MIILVTGGAGFIGSHLIESLLNKGHSVVCIDNFDSFYKREIKEDNIKHFHNNKRFKFLEADICNIDEVNHCFSTFKFDMVIHLAAKAGVRPSIENPIAYYKTNVLGTLNLLETMKDYDVKKMIFASSSSVYGNNEKVPFSEDDKVDFPISPYAASKKAGELICHNYHYLYGFDIFCLRFFTVYGPRQRPDLAIHKFTDLILKDNTIEIYGEGNTSRDYTYIDDIIHGIFGAVNNLKGFEIINLGESKSIKLLELITLIEKVIGKKSNIRYMPMQPGDVLRTFADINKAKNKIGYNPSWDIKDGIESFYNWKVLYG